MVTVEITQDMFFVFVTVLSMMCNGILLSYAVSVRDLKEHYYWRWRETTDRYNLKCKECEKLKKQLKEDSTDDR